MRLVILVLSFAVLTSAASAQVCWTPRHAKIAERLADDPAVREHFRKYASLARDLRDDACFQYGTFGRMRESDFWSMLDVQADGMPPAIEAAARSQKVSVFLLYAATYDLLRTQRIPLPAPRPAMALDVPLPHSRPIPAR